MVSIVTEAKLVRWAGFYVDSTTLATAYNANGLSLNFYMSYNLTHHDAWTGNLFFRGSCLLSFTRKTSRSKIQIRQWWGMKPFEVAPQPTDFGFGDQRNELRIRNSISMASDPVLLGFWIFFSVFVRKCSFDDLFWCLDPRWMCQTWLFVALLP